MTETIGDGFGWVNLHAYNPCQMQSCRVLW
jgi:hypothetical protein